VQNSKDEASSRTMKNFWNAKAREHAPFYIATWRGYESKDTVDFFLTADDAAQFCRAAGYQPTKQDRMLEIGCGIGRMTRGFAQLFGQVYAVDVSGEMIAQARQCLSGQANVHLYETNGTDLAIFDSDFFDFCFSFIVFQHVPVKSIVFNYVREAGRVLRPGGIFHFQVKSLPDPDVGVSPLLLAVKRSYRHFVRRTALLTWHRVRGGAGGFESPAWVGVSVTADEVLAVCHESGLAVSNIVGEGTQYMWITSRKPLEATG
jgi:SAM-dependent methyltransferase